MTKEQAAAYVALAENDDEYAYRKGKVYHILYGEKFRQPLSEWYAEFTQRRRLTKSSWQCACGRTIAKGRSAEHKAARAAGQCIACHGVGLCVVCGVRLIAKGKSRAAIAAQKKGMCHTCNQGKSS